MRRGHRLEQKINKLLKYLDSIGVHGHKNNPERLQCGTYIKGEPFDYEIIYKNKIIVFDAKECKTKKWKPQKKDIKQANNMIKCKNHGANAFFLVYFYNDNKLKKIDPKTFKEKELKNIMEVLDD